MPDVRQRFRSLDRVPVPELWGEALTRAQRGALPTRPSVRLAARRDAVGAGRRPRRLVVLLLAILVAAALLLASSSLFVGERQRTGGSNPLVFTVGGPSADGMLPGQVFAIDPDVASPDATPRLVHEAYAQRIHVSPDGRHALFESLSTSDRPEGVEPGLVLARTDGSGERALHDAGSYELGREFESIWAPDSHAVAWISWIESRTGTTEPSLMVADVDGGEPRRFAVPPAEDPHLVWSPDSVHVAYVEWGCESTERHLFVLDTATGQQREIGDGLQLPSLPAWAHDGRRLAATVATGEVVPASSPDENTLTCASRTGPNALVVGDSVTGVVKTLAAGVDAYDRVWSTDDRTILWTAPAAEGEVSVWSVPADGGQVAELASLRVGYGVWSPDATRLTWTAGDGDAEETLSLWVVDVADGTPRRIARDVGGSGPSGWPKWSPDGEWVAFFRDEPASADGMQRGSIWIVRPDGTEERLLVDASAGVDLGGVDW